MSQLNHPHLHRLLQLALAELEQISILIEDVSTSISVLQIACLIDFAL
jgi:hypothetical protein